METIAITLASLTCLALITAAVIIAIRGREITITWSRGRIEIEY